MTPADPPESRRYATLLVAGISIVVLTCVAFLVPVPYTTMKPGPAVDTLSTYEGKPVIDVGKGVKTYPTKGTLDFTTVSVSRADTHVSLQAAIAGFLDPDVAVVPHSLVYPDDQSSDAAAEQGQAELSSSKDSSTVAALRALGYTVPAVPKVSGVVDGEAADGRLEKDDRIVAVDGTDVGTADELVAAVGKAKPGDTIALDVRRDGKARTVDVVAKADPQDASKARIGILVGEAYDFPVDVTNSVGHSIGGPSAGMMFALAIYDKLTPGALTGGEDVAGTGTIDPDGVVGPIGGIRQKIAGAAAQGASIFLVPADNCKEAATGDDHGLELVEVEQLDDAISALETLAKDPDASVPRCG